MAPTSYQSVSSENKNGDEEVGLISRTSRSNDNNSNTKNNVSAFDIAFVFHAIGIGHQLKKRPKLTLSFMLLLACAVGHSLTVMYYWGNMKHGSSIVNNGPTHIEDLSTSREEKEVSNKKAQELADRQKIDQLDRPTIESEAYYNATLSKLLSHSHTTVGIGNMYMGKSKHSGLSSPPPPPPPSNCQASIMIIRHCEKGGVREHCNYLGFERAKYIASLFGKDNERWPAPSRIYALAPGERSNHDVKNWREVETVTPLSKKLNVTIDSSYGMDDKDKFANHLFELLRTGGACGNLAVVSWKHDDIPHLAQTLGCGPENGCPTDWDEMDFDSAWEIMYTYRKAQYAPYPEAEAKKKQDDGWDLLQWKIFGKVEKEGFDPLAFMKKIGDI